MVRVKKRRMKGDAVALNMLFKVAYQDLYQNMVTRLSRNKTLYVSSLLVTPI